MTGRPFHPRRQHGGNAELLEIVGSQMAQYFRPNDILAECRLVAFQSRVSQPNRDIHRRCLRLSGAPRRSIIQVAQTYPGTIFAAIRAVVEAVLA